MRMILIRETPIFCVTFVRWEFSMHRVHVLGKATRTAALALTLRACIYSMMHVEQMSHVNVERQRGIVAGENKLMNLHTNTKQIQTEKRLAAQATTSQFVTIYLHNSHGSCMMIPECYHRSQSWGSSFTTNYLSATCRLYQNGKESQER